MALRESEERLRLFTEHAPVALAMFDRGMRYLAVSRRWRADYGLGDEPIIGHSHYEIFPEIPERWKAVHRRGLSGEIVREEEDRFVRMDGSDQWLCWEVQPWRMDDGQVGGIVIFTEDISDRKRVQESLRESQGRLQAMLDHSPNLIFMKDLQGRYVDANTQFEQTFHLTRQDIIGKTDHDMFPSEHAAAYRANDLEVLKAGRSLQFEEVALHDDGLHTNIVWKFPLRRLDGTLSAICAIATDITKRKQVEAALHTVEARQRLLLKSAPVVIYSCGVTGDYGATFVSENVVEQLGHRPEDFTDDPEFWANHIHPDDRSRILAGLATIFETGQHEHEYRFLRKDGTYCWLHDEGRVIRNEAGVSQEMIGYQIDISARKEAEGQLQHSEGRLNQAIRLAKLGIFDHDHRTETLYWSPMMREIYGVPSDEPASLDGYLQLLHPHDRDAIVAAIQQAHDPSGDGIYAVEHRLLRRDGTVRWVSFRSSTLFEGDGPARKPVRTMGAMMDITERKQAEEQLCQSELRFRALVERIGDVFWISDPPNRKLVYVSQSFADVWGRNPNDLYEHFETWLDAIHADDRARVAENFLVSILTGIYDAEYRVVRPDGSIRWIHDRGKPLGLGTLVAGVAEDITERKQAEEALHQKQRELQNSQAQLQDLTTKLFTAQDHERQRIARDLHDDFSQRLTALVLDVAALQRHPPLLPELIGKALEPVREELTQLSDDLHNLAYQLYPPLLRHAGLQAAIEDYIDKAIERTGLQITLKVNNFPGVVPLEWSTCLFRVFQESLQNVAKHAKATEVLVKLSGSSKGIGLSVIDNGKGFDANDKSGHQKGLGLISMQERLRLLNGFLNIIHSRPADGTKVCAWIPSQEKKP